MLIRQPLAAKERMTPSRMQLKKKSKKIKVQVNLDQRWKTWSSNASTSYLKPAKSLLICVTGMPPKPSFRFPMVTN